MIAHTIIDVSEKGLVSRDRLAGLGDAAAAVPGVVFAYLFGSVALGDDGPLSDVDLAVYLDDTVDPSETRLAVIEAASRHLRTDRVDVVVLNSAPIALAGRVLASRRVVLDRQPFLRHRYESLTHRDSPTSAFWSGGTSPAGTAVVDRELVLRKVAQLEEYLRQLDEYRQLSVESYQRDWKTQRIVERTLHPTGHVERGPGFGVHQAT